MVSSILSALNSAQILLVFEGGGGVNGTLVLSKTSAENNLLGAAIAGDGSCAILDKIAKTSACSSLFLHTEP